MTDIIKTTNCIAIALGMLIACNTSNQLSRHSETQMTVGTAADTPRSSQPDKLVDAPDFTLNKADGKPFTLSEHEGEIVVINIWATWCGPCRKEIPDFIELQEEMKEEGVLFVGVSLDEEGWEVVRPFIKEYQINYPVVVYDDSFFDAYGPFQGIPITYVINQEGEIAYVTPGVTSKSRLKPVLQGIADS